MKRRTMPVTSYPWATLLERWPTLALPRFIYFLVPFFIVLLALLTLTFQINRQLTEQQQIFLSRNAHAAVRHASQLMREHLRLCVLLHASAEHFEQDRFQLQWDLVASRIQVMDNTLDTITAPDDVLQYYERYVTQWDAIQPQLQLWLTMKVANTATEQGDQAELALKLEQTGPSTGPSTEPDNEEMLQRALYTAMRQMEQDANQLAAHLQFYFEDEMTRWAAHSRFFNRLLTMSSVSFIIIILVMAVLILHFSGAQAATERSLRIGEQRLRVILDTLPDAVYRIRQDGICTDYKPAQHETMRHLSTTVHNYHVTDVLPDPIADIFVENVQRVLANGEQYLVEYQQPEANRLCSSNTSARTENARRENANSVHSSSRENHSYEARFLPSSQDEVQVIVRDITEEKQREQAVLQAQKMESLGVLAGGIAHDFNNLLTGMLGQASLAEAKLKRGIAVDGHLKKIVVTAERAADLTRQLLAYTGKGESHVAPLNINQLIQETTGLMETALPNRVELILDLEPDLPLVVADRGQIQQVVMNLFINGVEALPDSCGTITIATTNQEIREPVRTIQRMDHSPDEGLQPGHYVMLTVKDTGIGMEPATVARIFDPFFSTKSKGHGLGLSAILGIIHIHQGALNVQSQPGQGTLFTIWLPALAAEETELELLPLRRLELSTHAQPTVLIVDDEDAIRETAADILTEEGFTVMSAANGPQGIDLLKRHVEAIEIVLLDMKMPGMDGKETFYELRRIRSELPVIFTSGYSESNIRVDFNNADNIAFLPKPYSIDGLTQQIQVMLAPSTSPAHAESQLARTASQ